MKYVKKVENKKGRKHATIHLYDEIGFNGISASDFVNEMDSVDAEVKHVRINSIGGSVIEGFGILSAMLNFKANGGELHTYNDGLAASTAGWLLMAADAQNIHSKDYALLMLHGVTNDTPDKKFQNAIVKIFKGRTDLDVSSLMTNGVDNFFDAEEAANFGFYPTSNIENTGLNIGMPENLQLKEIANKAQNIINNNPKPLIMKRVINALGLQDGSSEEVVYSAVNNLRSELQDTKNKLTAANDAAEKQKTKMESMQNKLDEQASATAKVLVESYVNKGVFSPKDEEAKNALIANAQKDPEGFKAMADMIPVKASKIANGAAGTAGTTEDGTPETLKTAINGRTLRQLEKEDSALVAKIKNESFDTYVNMFNTQYGTQKTAEELQA